MKTYVNKSPKERGAMQTLYFNLEQTRELLSISDLALVQMQYYVAIAHQVNPNMEDATLAAMLDKPEKTIKNTRLALTKAGWFRRKHVRNKKQNHIIYDVGRAAVLQNSSANLHVSTELMELSEKYHDPSTPESDKPALMEQLKALNSPKEIS